MAKRTPPTHPSARRAIQALGERLRREMTQAIMAERVGVSVPTLKKLEEGDPTTSFAAMVRALSVLAWLATSTRSVLRTNWGVSCRTASWRHLALPGVGSGDL